LRRLIEGIEYPENNAADKDKVDVLDNIKSNQVVRQNQHLYPLLIMLKIWTPKINLLIIYQTKGVA
jgi:hypothetical protein